MVTRSSNSSEVMAAADLLRSRAGPRSMDQVNLCVAEVAETAPAGQGSSRREQCRTSSVARSASAVLITRKDRSASARGRSPTRLDLCPPTPRLAVFPQVSPAIVCSRRDSNPRRRLESTAPLSAVLTCKDAGRWRAKDAGRGRAEAIQLRVLDSGGDALPVGGCGPRLDSCNASRYTAMDDPLFPRQGCAASVGSPTRPPSGSRRSAIRAQATRSAGCRRVAR